MSEIQSILEELANEPIGPLLKGDGYPIFQDSWEAEAFAIGNILIKQGFLTCSEWVEIFSEQIKLAQAQGDPDRGDTYYSHWLSALEKLCFERGLSDFQSYQNSLRLWKKAIRNTPHGVPLALENAFLSQDDDHHDHHHHDHYPENMFTPISVVKLKEG